MKILHIITTIERGGAEKAVLALAIAQKERGHEVTIAPLKGEPELVSTLRHHDIKVLTLFLNKHPLIQICMLRKIRHRYELIHAHLPRAELIARVALDHGSYVVTRHNSEPFFPNAPRIVSSKLSRWVTRNTTVIAISNSVHTFLVMHKELHPTSQSKVIYYGYAPKKSKNLDEKHSNSESGKIRIGTISRLAPQKNLILLLQLTKNLICSGYRVETSIVGVGPLDFVLKKWAMDAGIENSVKFLGKTEQITEFLQELDFFVLTSNYEGFGLVLLEACDNSVPIIASNVSSIPEVLGPNHPGLFEVKSLESLLGVFEKLAHSQRLRARTIKLQKERLQLFTIDKYVSQHDKVYSSVQDFKSLPRQIV